MRADRLLSILMLLQTRGRMTARDLAEQLEVSERTIYRDLDALGMAGIPVYPERGPGGGYSLVDGYQTRLTGLNSAEIRALFLSTTTGPLADLGMAHALEDALLKLSASLSQEARSSIEQARQRFHIDSSWTPRDTRSASILSFVQDAIWQNRRICLVYRQDNGQQKRYLVDPYGLVAKASEWYLVAASSETQHTFSIERVLRVEETEQSFVRLEQFDLSTYWIAYQKQQEQNVQREQEEQGKKQVRSRMPQTLHGPRRQQVQQRANKSLKEKKATRPGPRTRFVHAHSKKTNYGSQKTENGRFSRSSYKKKSVSLQPSQLQSNASAFKKNHIKKRAFSHASYFASFSASPNAA